jgi:UDP-N-acetylmuramate: L-alanyl-gamma-D-glutamyl-meso-diaminopimelate ligase
MKIHLIAIGGAAMHNLALALHQNGHQITGSDDEIYNPALTRLAKAGILPAEFGWFPDKINTDLDCIILGMHARKDNPELAKAQALGLKIYSYPEYIYLHAENKKRVVIAGSHGKTTTTSMIMHVLHHWKRDFDYLVGAMLEGFDTMVRLSDAPVMIIEGDEYLASPIDLVPKIHHYKPHIATITGIAWDHMNVFPTFENYVNQFKIFIETIDKQGVLFYDEKDKNLVEIAQVSPCKSMPYAAFDSVVKRNKTYIVTRTSSPSHVTRTSSPSHITRTTSPSYETLTPLSIFGEHNLTNLKAAYLVCREIGVSDEQFFEAVKTFKGAAKRLQVLCKTSKSIAFLDFAHAPSKVKATIEAMKAQYPKRSLVAALELHTFSSLNKDFLPQYSGTMAAADIAIVFFNEHTLEMKKMPPLSIDEVKSYFNHPNLHVFTDNQVFTAFLKQYNFENQNLLLMTSGTFVGLDLKALAVGLLA